MLLYSFECLHIGCTIQLKNLIPHWHLIICLNVDWEHARGPTILLHPIHLSPRRRSRCWRTHRAALRPALYLRASRRWYARCPIPHLWPFKFTSILPLYTVTLAAPPRRSCLSTSPLSPPLSPLAHRRYACPPPSTAFPLRSSR